MKHSIQHQILLHMKFLECIKIEMQAAHRQTNIHTCIFESMAAGSLNLFFGCGIGGKKLLILQYLWEEKRMVRKRKDLI